MERDIDEREGAASRARRIATRAGDRLVGLAAGTDAVIRRAGFTKDDGRISKSKLAIGALRPRRSGRRLARAAVAEIDRRRNRVREH